MRSFLSPSFNFEAISLSTTDTNLSIRFADYSAQPRVVELYEGRDCQSDVGVLRLIESESVVDHR